MQLLIKLGVKQAYFLQVDQIFLGSHSELVVVKPAACGSSLPFINVCACHARKHRDHMRNQFDDDSLRKNFQQPKTTTKSKAKQVKSKSRAPILQAKKNHV